MRAQLRVIAVAAAIAGIAPLARAGGSGDHIDISKVKSQLVVLHDGHGHYVAVQPYKLEVAFYYGNGKVFYRQRTLGGFASPNEKQFSRNFWSPRTNDHGELELDHGHWQVQCGKRKTPLVVATSSESSKILDHAVFKKPLWKRQAHLLARNDRGVYFYVDRFRPKYGGKGFRLWVGPKGNLHRTRMVNVVSDSVGEIFATRSGALRLVRNGDKVVWVRHRRHTQLTLVPVAYNIQLIYRDLGVYTGRLGTPCDDM